MLSKSDLTPLQKSTILESEELTVPLSTNGTARTSGESSVSGNDLDMFIVLQFLEDSPAVSSLG